MTTIAVYSYSVAAIGFLLLIGLLFTIWRGRTQVAAIALACGFTALWSASLAGQAATGHDLWSVWTDTLEILRSAAWCVVLLLLLGNSRDPASRWPFSLRTPIFIGAVCYVILLLVTVLVRTDLMLNLNGGLLPNVTARVCQAVLGMLLVEQVYRNKTIQERWAIKFACLGIGAHVRLRFLHVQRGHAVPRHAPGHLGRARHRQCAGRAADRHCGRAQHVALDRAGAVAPRDVPFGRAVRLGHLPAGDGLGRLLPALFRRQLGRA